MLYNFSNTQEIDNPITHQFTNQDEVARIQTRTIGKDPRTLIPNPSYDDYSIKTKLNLHDGNIGDHYDLAKFNKIFEHDVGISYAHQKLLDAERLNQLQKHTESDETVNVSDLSINQTLMRIKKTWFEILDDLLDQRFQSETFTKNNRMFYIGITIIILFSVLYVFIMVIEPNEPTKQSSEKVIYYVYPTTKKVK